MKVSEAVEYTLGRYEMLGEEEINLRFQYREMNEDWERLVAEQTKTTDWKELKITNEGGRLRHLKKIFNEEWERLQNIRKKRDKAGFFKEVSKNWYSYLLETYTQNGDFDLKDDIEKIILGDKE